MKTVTDVARPIAPEDIRIGDYIAIMSTVVEWPPFFFDQPFGRVDVVRTHHLPCSGGEPLKVQAICIPFLLVRNHKDEHTTIDLRRHRIAKLSEAFGKKASKKLAAKGDKLKCID
jgi:hypothetical protein